MKINFPLPTDNKRHRYCLNCSSEDISENRLSNKTLYSCHKCGNSYERIIDIDPKHVWWVDPKTKDYWHESVGVFVINKNKEILFMERTIYPVGLLTIPSGHRQVKDNPKGGAARELLEETGIDTHGLTLLDTVDIKRDLCRHGADSHRWNVYIHFIKSNSAIVTDPEEGINPTWLSVEKAKSSNLIEPVKHLLSLYAPRLLETVS